MPCWVTQWGYFARPYPGTSSSGATVSLFSSDRASARVGGSGISAVKTGTFASDAVLEEA